MTSESIVCLPEFEESPEFLLWKSALEVSADGIEDFMRSQFGASLNVLNDWPPLLVAVMLFGFLDLPFLGSFRVRFNKYITRTQNRHCQISRCSSLSIHYQFIIHH